MCWPGVGLGIELSSEVKAAVVIGFSRSLKTVDSDIVKALDEIKGVADILIIVRQNSKESFCEIMDSAVKMADDMNTAAGKVK